jgi:hypothetical protein
MNINNALTETRKTAEWFRALAKEQGEPKKDAFYTKKAEALLAVCDEVERLKSALPKTMDGVTIVPNMKVWRYMSTHNVMLTFRVAGYHRWAWTEEQKYITAMTGMGFMCDAAKCFSTLQAAEAGKDEQWTQNKS